MSSNTSIDKMNLLRTQSNKLNSTSESILNISSTAPSTPTTLLPVNILIDENLISDFSSSMASIPNNFSTINNKTKTIVNRSRSEDSTHESDLARLNSRVKIGNSSSNLHSIDTNEISSQIGTAEYADTDNEDTINDKSSPSSPSLNGNKTSTNSTKTSDK